MAGNLRGAQVSDTQTLRSQQSVTVDAGQPATLNRRGDVGASGTVLASDLVPGASCVGEAARGAAVLLTAEPQNEAMDSC